MATMATTARIEAQQSAMQRHSGSATTLQLINSKLSASLVGRLIDQTNDDLGKPPEDKDVVAQRALRWAAELRTVGITDANAEAVFRDALRAKTDTFKLALPELLTAARRVAAKAVPASGAPQPLSDPDCEFILGMIPQWFAQQTEASREYLLRQRAAFAANATTANELILLAALNALELGE